MSLLTRIGNLKSKYRETAGYITQERAAIQGIMGKRGKSVAKAQGLMSDFKKGRRSLVETYGTQADIDSFSDDTDLGELAGSFYERKFEEFKQTEGFNDWAIYMSAIERMQNKPSGFNTGLMLQQYAEKAKQGTADFAEIVMNPYKELTSSADQLSSIYKEYQSAYDEVGSYDADISAAQQRLEGYGASQQEIEGMLTEAEQMYGMSTEQRKRGTRGSARRRTALTSRSGYA